MLQVSLFTGPGYLVEDEGTVSAHAFLATDGVIPEGGLVVSVDAPNLSEFDLAGISVEGGEIAAVRDGGFDLRMMEYTTLVNVPIANDDETEVGETATFSLAAGDGYEIVSDYSGGTFNLVDTASDIPQGVISEPNHIISEAVDTQISPENPTFFGSDAIYFNIGDRYLNDDGTYTYIDYSEDVDVYKVQLKAGDTVAIETFDSETNTNPFGAGNDLATMVFDAEGNRLRDYDASSSTAAPDKLFGGVSPFDENQTDGYQEFTAPEDGAYYFAFGSFNNVTTYGFSQNFRTPLYEPFTPGSGGGNRAIFGNYSIQIDLLTEDNPRKIGTPTPPVSNPDVTNPPTLSLSASTTTIDSEGNFTNAVVEHLEEFDGISSVTFTIQAEGDIPEGGIEFVLNSDANLFDYVSLFAQSSLPSTIGGQSLGAFYNEDGIPTGIRLLIDEPLMTVNYEAANPASFTPDFNGNALEVFEPLETDGAEDVTFFLQPGEGYEIAADAGTVDVTYYDSVADVPPPTAGGDVIPEVGVTITESELIETEQTETTINFTLSEPPPEDGLTIFLDSDSNVLVGSVLSQFDVLGAEISGGDFPSANGDSSGFFFNITEPTATVTISAFDELTVAGIDSDAVQEGIIDINFALQPQAGYTIDPDASEINLTIADNPDSQIQVSYTNLDEFEEPSPPLIEAEGTVGIHTFSLSAAPPPEGLTVSVSTPSLANFNLDAIEVAGGTIAAVRNDGFDFTITEQTATINLPILDDGVDEGSETATFALEPGDTYELNPVASEVTFVLADTIDQVSVPEEIELISFEETNNTILEADVLSLSPENPSVSINGLIGEEFQDLPEDVDFFSFNLEAGQTVALDIDTEPSLVNGIIDFREVVFPEFADILQTFDNELRLFDAEGNELANNNDGAAPGEEFSRDPYLEFTAEQSGTYYVGVSTLGNRNYDPFVERSGSGWTFPEVGVFHGFYELTATLEDGTTNPEPTPGELPVVSLTVTPETLNEDEGTILTYNFAIDGEIPEGGLVFRSQDLFDAELDWPSFNFGNPDPSELSGLEIVDFERVVADNGNATFLVTWNMTEQEGFLKLPVVNDDVADAPDNSFSVGLLPGDGYVLNPEASDVTVAVTDGIDNTGGPIISMAVSDTEVNEGDPITITFTAEGDLPEGGQEIFITSDVQNALGEFVTIDENGNPRIVIEGLANIEPTFSGFIATMEENTASISLNVFDDGPGEGTETFSYSLSDGETYDINADSSSFAITVDDSFIPVFGSVDGDVIEVEGSNQLVFGGSSDDLIDASISSRGGNRIYGSGGDDTFILGTGDRAFGGEGDDQFYATFGGGNTITGGAGEDQFWIATASIPDAANIITDFTSGEDVLGLAGLGIGFEDLSITQQDDNTLIAASGSDLAILQGIGADSLMADNFAFV